MRVVELAGDVILVTMNSEENNFGTVIIDGETWAVTPGNENNNMVVGNSSTPDADPMVVGDEDSIVPPATETNESNTEAIAAESLDEAAADLDDAAVSAGEDETAEPEFDALRALTALLLGGAIEGTSQLVSRLEQYEEELRKQAAEREQDADAVAVQENEMDKLRYALVGFVLDAQSTLKRNVSLWARVVDSSVRATNRVASPVSSRLSGPFQRRYDRLVRRGEQSLSRWIADGRTF